MCHSRRTISCPNVYKYYFDFKKFHIFGQSCIFLLSSEIGSRAQAPSEGLYIKSHSSKRFKIPDVPNVKMSEYC